MNINNFMECLYSGLKISIYRIKRRLRGKVLWRETNFCPRTEEHNKLWLHEINEKNKIFWDTHKIEYFTLEDGTNATRIIKK